MGVTVTGRVELARGLAALTAALADGPPGLDVLAEAGASAAASFAPRRSGRLAGSFTAAVAAGRASFGSPLVYAGVQDGGWPAHGITGQRFMARAAAEVDARAGAVVDGAITRTIAQEGL